MNDKDDKIIEEQSVRLKNLRKIMSRLIFFSEEEINEIVNKMRDMPKEAFEEIFKILKEGKAKQNEVLHKILEKNPDFLRDFKNELQKQFKKATKKIEKKESKKAGEILDELKNI